MPRKPKPSIDELISERLAIDVEIDNLTERRSAINDAIIQALPDGGTIGDTKVTITRPRRLDTRKLQANYPPIQHPELYKPSLDTAAVKRYFADAQLDDYRITGNPSVRLS